MGSIREILHMHGARYPRYLVPYLNAVGGAIAGLHTMAEATRLLRRVIVASRNTIRGSTNDLNTFNAVCQNMLELRSISDVRHGIEVFRPDEHVLPVHTANVPNLSKLTLYRVVSLYGFAKLLTAAEATRFDYDHQVRFPANGKLDGRRDWMVNLAKVEPVDRVIRVAPDQELSQGWTWFTDEGSIERLKRGPEKLWARAFRDQLGLIHIPRVERAQMEPTALFLLQIPGSCLQSSGHWRPSFADAGPHRRFLARSSVSSPSPAAVWGQAAALDLLSSGHLPFDGCSERVAPTLFGEDVGGTIPFSFLGQIDAVEGGLTESEQVQSDREFVKRL